MQQKIIVSNSPERLNEKMKNLIADGWKPVGSHKVVVTHVQNRYAGTQHMDSIHRVEYSQSMYKD